MVIKKCECGSKSFYAMSENRVFFELNDDGVLKTVEEENVGLDFVFCCDECDREYTACNFKEIL